MGFTSGNTSNEPHSGQKEEPAERVEKKWVEDMAKAGGVGVGVWRECTSYNLNFFRGQ